MALIQANNEDLLKVLKERGTVYVIPKYQRDFAWDEENFRNLWEDLCLSVFDKGEEMFMGSVIISPSEANSIEIDTDLYFPKDVIDGQQRLTTILILLRALYDLVSDERKEWAKENIYNPYFLAKAPEGEFKLRLSGNNRAFFNDYILDVSNINAPSRKGMRRASEKRIISALRYFKDRISERASGDLDKTVESIFNSLKDNLVIVLIEARSDVDAYSIFETINSKNRDLTPSELLKNYFYSSVSDNKVVLNKVTAIWEYLADQLSVNDLDITEFVRHHWISTHLGKVSEKRLYRSIKEETKRDGEKVVVLTKSLKSEVDYYVDIASPDNDDKSDLGNCLKSLKELGVKQCYPLVLSLFANKTDRAEIVKVLKKIIIVSLRRGLTDRNPNELESIYSEYAYSIREKGEVKIAAFLKELDKLDVEEKDFRNSLKNSSVSPKITKFILMRLEEDRQTDEKRLVAKDLEIEHILPVNPENLEDWGMTSEEHDDYLETIGNKTLVGPSFNKEMSNKKFSEKCKTYSKSEVNITSDLPKIYSSWSVQSIQKRTNDVADKLEELYKD